VLPTARRVDLLDEGLYQSYLRDPALFANGLRTLPRAATVVVDEIQRLPTLLNEVHRFIEDRGLRFVLLESIARKLKQASTSLLAGRAAHLQMFPLLPQELGRDSSHGGPPAEIPKNCPRWRPGRNSVDKQSVGR
jgi:predicted AAA+ superfamily ATPase